MNTIIHTLSSPVFKALGWSLLHSLWQTLAMYICLRLTLFVIKNAAAKTKYIIAYSFLSFGFICFLFTFFRQLKIQQLLIEKSSVLINLGNPNLSEILTGAAFRQILPHTKMFYIEQAMPFIVLIYLVGIFVFGLRFIRNYRQIVFLKTKGLIEVNNSLKEKISRLSAQLNISSTFKIFFSKYAETPVMLGFLKPMILLPVAFINNLSIEETEAILIHELAHIRRNDYLFNLLQSVIETVLFFNPFVWLISKIIRHEREKSCDEIVIEFSEPRVYAHALLSLEKAVKPALAHAAGDKQYQLLNRIKNFTMKKNTAVNAKQKVISVFIIAMGIFSIAWFSPKKHYQKNSPAISFMKKNNDTAFSKINIDSPKIFVPAILPKPMPAKVSVSHKNYAEDSAPDFDTEKISKYFNSDAWKKQQEAMQEQVAKIQAQVNSKAFKEEQEKLSEQAAKLAERAASIKNYYNNEAFKEQQKALELQQEKMMKYFNSDEWKQEQKSIEEKSKQLKKYFNSSDWKKRQNELYRLNDSLKLKIRDEIQLQLKNADTARISAMNEAREYLQTARKYAARQWH